MTAGGMLLLALPIPALLSDDGWMAAAGEALPIVATAALFAAAALAATCLKRRLARKARHNACVGARRWQAPAARSASASRAPTAA